MKGRTETETKPEIQSQPDIFSIREIEARLTYPFLPGVVMVFFFKLQLEAEAKKARQLFTGLTPEEKDANRAAYNLELAASLMTRLPEGVPGLIAETQNLAESKQIFKEFFAGDNELKKIVLEDALNLYFARVQPIEFFRGY